MQAFPAETGYIEHDLLCDVWRLELSPPRWAPLESRDALTGVQPARAYGASVAACASLAACGATKPLHLFGGGPAGGKVPPGR